MLYWTFDRRSPACRVYLWDDEQELFLFKSVHLRQISDPDPVHVRDLDLEIGENLIRIISSAPQGRNFIAAEPVYLTLIMNDQGHVIIK